MESRLRYYDQLQSLLGHKPRRYKEQRQQDRLGQLVSSYLHENLTGGTTYYYVITETLNGSEGVESAEVSATPPFSTSITLYASDGSFTWQRGVNGNASGVAMAALPTPSFT